MAFVTSCWVGAGAAAACVAALVVAGWRTYRLLRAGRAGTHGSPRVQRPALVRHPAVAGAAAAVCTALPWVRGSVHGVALPETLWGLPFVAWMVATPVALAVVGSAVCLRTAWARAWSYPLIALMYSAAAVLAAVVLVVASAAQSLSRAGLGLKALLAGSGIHAADYLPVIRVGPGAWLFIVATVGGAWLSSLAIPWTPRAPASTDAEARLPAPRSLPADADAPHALPTPDPELWS